jgi:1,4-alpha-glucan branching enzyme
MYSHPGKKLTFMGAEFGQVREWSHDRSLDWHLLDDPLHQGLRRWVQVLNHTYQREPSLHQVDFEPAGFSWVDCNDNENSVISMIRRARNPNDFAVMLANFTPVPRLGYRVGVPEGGWYRELLNSDAAMYGGGNVGNGGGVAAEDQPSHGFNHSLTVTVPPLGFVLLKR